jgi:hypothetical protein
MKNVATDNGLMLARRAGGCRAQFFQGGILVQETMSLEPLLSTEEAAQFLNVSPSWLAKARMRGDGPEYILIGGRIVRYTRTSLLRFTAERTRKQTIKRNLPRKRREQTD